VSGANGLATLTIEDMVNIPRSSVALWQTDVVAWTARYLSLVKQAIETPQPERPSVS
jgi:hypothetical protein